MNASVPQMRAAADPLLVLLAWVPAACVASYWCIVAAKSIRMKRRQGKTPNVIPAEKIGRYLRLIWIPTVIAWISLCFWYAVTGAAHAGALFRPLFFTERQMAIQSAVGAVLCVTALLLTMVCWRQMGRSWRIGIDPGEKTELVARGAYQFVRHPIYALSIVLMLGCLLVIPAPAMLAVAVVHGGLLVWEAKREERHLLRQHGEVYGAYCRNVGGFFPRRLIR